MISFKTVGHWNISWCTVSRFLYSHHFFQLYLNSISKSWGGYLLFNLYLEYIEQKNSISAMILGMISSILERKKYWTKPWKLVELSQFFFCRDNFWEIFYLKCHNIAIWFEMVIILPFLSILISNFLKKSTFLEH